MASLEPCGIGELIQDTIAQTLMVNRRLANGEVTGSADLKDFFAHLEGNGIDVAPGGDPLQVIALEIGCNACGDTCRVSFHPDNFTEISLPVGCQMEDLSPGEVIVGMSISSNPG